MTDAGRNGLVSLDELLQVAEDAGYGDRNLRKLFSTYRHLGLVGKTVTKAARQGGEGLWHPTQRDLWLAVVHARIDDRVRLPTLTNLPVAAWLAGVPGIETSQAQRAFGTWIDELRPPTKAPRERSLRRRALDHRVDWLAMPGATAQARRELRQLLEIVNDSGGLISPDTYANAVLKVLAPDGKPSPMQRAAAHNAAMEVALQALAYRQRDRLLADTPDTLTFWEWARTHHQTNYVEYQARHPTLRTALPDIAHLFTDPSLAEFVSTACAVLLTHLALGLAYHGGDPPIHWPPDEAPPPNLALN